MVSVMTLLNVLNYLPVARGYRVQYALYIVYTVYSTSIHNLQGYLDHPGALKGYNVI